MNIKFVEECIRNKNLRFTKHAIQKMIEREIEPKGVMHALMSGEVIERNYESKPYPSFLVLGCLKSGDPLHIKCSKSDVYPKLRMVTVYEPSDEEWEKNFKTRKKGRR